ncbi:MAG: inorganic pyrophosphatase [Acidimicrobiia bacterium]|nr:MAG: inorganic pyrophosphatase [Acidimicrobiia bacterium]
MAFPDPFFQWRPHPWHGLAVGPDPPQVVTAFIEITPFDVVKYEVEKRTGYLKVDRPQRGSSSPPTLYGLIPRTYCGQRVAALSPEVDVADGDPLDVCVVSERPIDRAEVMLDATVIGGIRMIDSGEADDKIIAVLVGDAVWSSVEDLDDLPGAIVARLVHYFLTYKVLPGEENRVSVPEVYDKAHAFTVVEAAMADYADTFGG